MSTRVFLNICFLSPNLELSLDAPSSFPFINVGVYYLLFRMFNYFLSATFQNSSMFVLHGYFLEIIDFVASVWVHPVARFWRELFLRSYNHVNYSLVPYLDSFWNNFDLNSSLSSMWGEFISSAFFMIWLNARDKTVVLRSQLSILSIAIRRFWRICFWTIPSSAVLDSVG